MEIKNILVVDDEFDLCEILKHNLEANGFEVDTAHSAEEALKTEIESFDLLLLDVMMEGLSGIELLKKLRSEYLLATPVIFISAMGAEYHLLEGFNNGADDYITKPFSINEVLARVNALLNRSKNLNQILKRGINIDRQRKRVFVDKEPVDLTRTEFDILNLLINQPGKVYSRDEILNTIWDAQQSVAGRTVDVNITRLRKKLGNHGPCIVTRSGYGYYFDERKILAES